MVVKWIIKHDEIIKSRLCLFTGAVSVLLRPGAGVHGVVLDEGGDDDEEEEEERKRSRRTSFHFPRVWLFAFYAWAWLPPPLVFLHPHIGGEVGSLYSVGTQRETEGAACAAEEETLLLLLLEILIVQILIFLFFWVPAGPSMFWAPF